MLSEQDTNLELFADLDLGEEEHLDNSEFSATENKLYTLFVVGGAVLLPVLATFAHPLLGVGVGLTEAYFFNKKRVEDNAR